MKSNNKADYLPGHSESNPHASDFITAQGDSSFVLRDIMEEQAGMEPSVFLPYARAIASAIRSLHQQQMIHLDLRPERVTLLPDHACVIDSGYAVNRLEGGYTRPDGFVMSEASLPYCSPENTGRMLRPVDERSDLYSVGVMFYEMLTGHLPFAANNPLEWVYLHLAQSPPPPTHPKVQIPDGLIAIIMKLLEKNPDYRYQNANYLIVDLDKIDHPHDTFRMEPGFYGRTHEISVLTQAYLAASYGSTELVYVAGEAGIGKTSLLDQVFRKQYRGDFFYITGKFEQLSNESPYHPIMQAFRGLMRHLLGEGQQRVEQWRHKLNNALSGSAELITSMIPEAELIIGHVAPAEELPANEARKRFLYVFRKFVQTLATKEHPLVFFIDDLQWADSSSLQLIHALLSDPECQYVLMICAYRDKEIDPARLPGYETDGSPIEHAVIRHLQLDPLHLQDMNQIVMEMLHHETDMTLSLTELLYHRTNGNPFHLRQILLRLLDDGILSYNQEKRSWEWDLGRMIEQDPSYAIHQLIDHRLRRLPKLAQELLSIAASIGSTFHPELIAVVGDCKASEMDAAWTAIELEGLVAPFGSDQCRFVHDSIQQFIYGRLDDESRQRLHIRIGRALSGIDAQVGAYIFEIVNHLNRGSDQIRDPKQLLQLIELNLDAGNRAKASSAYDVALGYFRKGAGLLVAENWDRAFDLCFELHAQQAECEYLCGFHENSDREMHFLLERARSPMERSRVQMIRIMQHINQGKYLEGTALGLECLAEHRIIISANPSKFMLLMEGMRLEALLRPGYNKLIQLEEMSDPERITAMNLILAIIPSTFFTNKNVFFLLVCRAIQLSLRYGNSPVSAAVYAAYGMILGTAAGKFDQGYALAKIGVELSERYNAQSIMSKTYTMFGGVLCQFAGHASEGDAYLAKALRYGMGSGDYVFASYAMGAHINSLYTRAPLNELARSIADYMGTLDTTNDEFVKQNFYLYQQFILALQGGTDAPDSFSGGGFEEAEFLSRIREEETAATTLYQFSTYKAQLCYLLGRYEEAIRWARDAKPYESFATHLPHLGECLFYASLAELAVWTPTRRSPHGTKALNRQLRLFRKWAAWSPANFQARLYLLQAEYARASGDHAAAESGYDQAIRAAREYGNIHIAGLTAERAAHYYMDRGHPKTARFYLDLALEGYNQWELPIKIEQMERQIHEWLEQEADSEHSAKHKDIAIEQPAASQAASEWPTKLHAMDNNVDLAVILQTTRAITNQADQDTVLEEILHTMMKYAGASKGALLTNNQEAISIQAYVHTAGQTVPLPCGMTDSSLVPEGIARYVFRTQEEVHFDAGVESWLIHNPYIAIHQPQSVLCLPVAIHGTLLGVLYLENKLMGGIFTPDRKAVLLAMAAHGLFLYKLHGSADPTDSGATDGVQPPSAVMEEPLTDRELEVLALLAAGLSNKEIADRLIIALGTVKVHVKNIFAKLKVNRRTKAIAQAKELKLLDENNRFLRV
ncbi:helix-turn-helix transcriptional regulator [Paenibacillus guangzhouensis]|uniref:helix-turn-helix transcriptional regulator n=1 Tax=Paenibacillus guangzhouensis TaxID=1473112 RepID=UPI001D1172AB|nr:AAA family ATPase [Paenibacillus guangzhouensis]